MRAKYCVLSDAPASETDVTCMPAHAARHVASTAAGARIRQLIMAVR